MAQYLVEGRKVSLTGDPAAFTYTVKIGDGAWSMTEHPYVLFENGDKILFPAPVSEGTFTTGTTQGIKAEYKGFGDHGITVITMAEIELISDDVYFTLRVDGDERCEIKEVSFPAPFDFGAKYGDKPDQRENFLPYSYTVLSRRSGELFPVGLQVPLGNGEIYEADAYMPIYGQVRGGTGYLAIYDTPFDAKYEMRYEDGDKVAPLWITSLGHIAYPRRMIYRFMVDCDYVDMAKSYRSYKKRRGQLVTLREKVARNPKAEALFGCPIIHTTTAKHVSPDSQYYDKDDPSNNDSCTTFATRAEQIKALHAKGLKKAYTHFDGWGHHGYDNLHPDPQPPHEGAGGWDGLRELGETVNGCGYIFGIHDQYRDYYYEAPSFSFDNAVTNADGSHPYCDIWWGGKHSYLCSELAARYVRRNFDTFEEMNIPIKAAYLDVFSICHMDECFHPDHPATREQCAKNRRAALDVLTEKGIIPSSEEALDCITPSLILCHHAPYTTKYYWDFTSPTWGIAIPWFNLVYHDCLVIPWDGKKGKKGGMSVPGTDSAHTHAWLNGNPQYLDIEGTEEDIAEVEATCANAEKLTYQEMVKHEFISADMRSQRTTFTDGTVIEVNFDTGDVTVK